MSRRSGNRFERPGAPARRVGIEGLDIPQSHSYTGTVKNITLSVEDEVYQAARVEAAKRRTSLSAVVRGYLRLFARGQTAVLADADDEDRNVVKLLMDKWTGLPVKRLIAGDHRFCHVMSKKSGEKTCGASGHDFASQLRTTTAHGNQPPRRNHPDRKPARR